MFAFRKEGSDVCLKAQSKAVGAIIGQKVSGQKFSMGTKALSSGWKPLPACIQGAVS